jgi:ABC-type glycerol-3-phosphate transport system substrate-binding protein
MPRNGSHKKIRLIKHVWALSLLLLVTACSCLEAPSPAEPVTIRFARPDAEDAYYEDVDAFFVSPFALSFFLERELLLDLNPIVRQDDEFGLSDFYPATLELFTRDGQLWAIRAGVTVQVLYYNQDLFVQYSVPYPQPRWMWDDFLDTTKALRDPGSDAFGYGDVDQFFDPLIFIYLHGGSVVNDMQNPTRMTYDDPKTIQALEWYAALMHDDNIIPDRSQFYDLGGTASPSSLTGGACSAPDSGYWICGGNWRCGRSI